MLHTLDDLLNRITMYKLVLWGLRILAGISFTLSFTGAVGQSLMGLAISLSILSAVCYATNWIFARIWKVPANTESYAITLLILFFILPPATTVERGIAIAAAGLVAMASKFLLAYRGKIIFNPAAFAPFLLGLLGILHASWWVGSSVLWPLTLTLGLLVVRKIRRFSLFLSFVAVSLTITAITAVFNHQTALENLKFAITSSPLIFLGTIMLTEPSTMPPQRHHQIIFGALVGFLYSMPWNLGPLTVYPETALLIGNLYAFAMSPRYRLKLTVKEVQKISDRVYNYVFVPDQKVHFVPGQYMDWTLDYPNHDGRGNRRTFSIASSPTEDTIQAGVKFYEPSSSFKKAMRNLKPGDHIFAGQTAGDFVLPEDKNLKLLFIAAGIGVTPFRSMLKYLVDSGEKRDVVVIYAVSDPAEVAYEDVLQAAKLKGIEIVPLLTSAEIPRSWRGATSKLDVDFIAKHIPDYKDRRTYISGPNGLVDAMRSTLQKAGVSRTQIKTDHFSGY